MLGEATLDVSGTFLGEAIRFPIQIAALQVPFLFDRVKKLAFVMPSTLRRSPPAGFPRRRRS